MKTIRVVATVAGVLASFALAPAALAQPPESVTYTYPNLECSDEVQRTFHLVGSLRLWDEAGDSYLIRSITQTMSRDGATYGPSSRTWGQGDGSEQAITCTGGEFDLQGFWVESIQLTAVAVP